MLKLFLFVFEHHTVFRAILDQSSTALIPLVPLALFGALTESTLPIPEIFNEIGQPRE